MKTKITAAVAVLALSSTAAIAGGWGNNNNWGNNNKGVDRESIMGSFEGEIFSGNVAVSEGDKTTAETMNLKAEFGSIRGVQQSNGPDMMKVEGSLMTLGAGIATARSTDMRGKGSRASSGVLGQMDGKLTLKTIERD